MTVVLNVCVCVCVAIQQHTHTHADPPIHLKNITGVHTLVHINPINYVLHHLENTSLCTDNIYETETRSIISTKLLPTVIRHTQ